VKKIFEEFETDPIVGIERFKFDISPKIISNSSTINDNYSLKSQNNECIEIHDKINKIREAIPSLSSSISLRLLSYYHWDINTLIDEYTSNDTNVITNCYSFKTKSDSTNEKRYLLSIIMLTF